MMEVEFKAPPALDRYQRISLIVGVAALALFAVGGLLSPAEFFRSYLLAYAFWIGIALGCLSIVMIHHLAGGAWGLVIRRVLESAIRTFPLWVLLFVPLILGLKSVWIWANQQALDADPKLNEVVHHKAAYLNVSFFLVRAAFYFAVWLGLSYFLNRWSREQDETGEQKIQRRLQNLSGPGLILVGGTVTFASVDWLMSLDPHWFSTIFGILVLGGQGLSAMAFVITVMFLLSNYKPMSDVLTPKHFHDLGKLLLAFVMLWAYFAFSQFLIIWSGNLPEEITWYLGRLSGGWKAIAGLLILLHFALPFLLLLPRSFNRNARLLSLVAWLILVMRYIDLFWLIGPSGRDAEGRPTAGLQVSWMDFVAPIGLGGIWLWFFIRQLKQRPLMPINDPYLEQAISHGRGEH
ncbi:MAG TPA: hypothetical protein VGV87_20780 [Blastocatellia bacterium]|jgi:hypothetical protein|nr:hypothetical protein [Blastocatellia bacterium]